MATSESVGIADRKRSAIPPALFNACFALLVINLCYFPVAYFSGMWIWEASGLGVPTDFVNVWAAGKLALEGHPALAYDWDIQKQVELALLGQDFPGYFAWHYPPPFLFVASLLAMLPYSAAFIGWMAASLVPYLAVIRAIVGRPFGWMLAVAFPMVFSNTLVGQNGFLTAAQAAGVIHTDFEKGFIRPKSSAIMISRGWAAQPPPAKRGNIGSRAKITSSPMATWRFSVSTRDNVKRFN